MEERARLTTASQLLAAVSDFRQRLLANEAQAAATMEAAHAETLKRIEVEISKLYGAMTEAIASGEPWSLSKLYEAQRLETLKKLITGEIDQFGALAKTMVGRLQEDGAHLGLDAAQHLMQAQVPPGISWSFGQPSQEALAQLVGATQSGSPLAMLFNGFGAEAAQKAGQALITGVSLGQNPRQFAGAVKDALGISRNRALVISRQESLRCYRSAALESYRANDDVVGQWRWTCAKNKRSCIACLMMDGKLFPLTQEFVGHVQDRCAPVPVTKDWSEILGPLGIDTSAIPDTRPNIETGEAWFHRQSEETQRSVLGSSAYDLWRSPTSKITLQDFVGYKSDKVWGDKIRVRSLKDLRGKTAEELEQERKAVEAKLQEEAKRLVEQKATSTETAKAEARKQAAKKAAETRARNKAEAERKAKQEAELKAAQEKAAQEEAAKLKAEKAARAKAKRDAAKQAEIKPEPKAEVKVKAVTNVATLKAKYSHCQFEFGGIDKKLHARVAKHIDKLFTDYPQVAKSMEFIGSGTTPTMKPGSTRAIARRAEKHGNITIDTNKIFLNPEFWSNEQKLVNSLKKDVASGWKPRGGDTAESVITHEFGHSINYYLDRSSAAATKFQEQNKSLGDRVCGYARYGGPAEAWADAFASLYYTPPQNRTQYAKNLDKFLKQQFGGK
jgi:hypothetical protein